MPQSLLDLKKMKSFEKGKDVMCIYAVALDSKSILTYYIDENYQADNFIKKYYS